MTVGERSSGQLAQTFIVSILRRQKDTRGRMQMFQLLLRLCRISQFSPHLQAAGQYRTLKKDGERAEMNTVPYWRVSEKLPEFTPLSNDLEVDVVIIGGGLTGITTAHLLKEAGAKVALLERQRCAAADTGHTTAHLTYVTDERLHHLVKVFGKDAAKAFWEAGVEAIDRISEIVRAKKMECEFSWVPGFLHASLTE